MIDDNGNPLLVSAERVLSFLTEGFGDGIGHSALNSTGAALALIFSDNIANNQLIRRLIRGYSKIRPNPPEYEETWDVDPVPNNPPS